AADVVAIPVDDCVPLGRVAHIAAQPAGSHSALGQLLSGLLAALDLSCAEDNVRAELGQGPRHLPPDPAAAACHDRGSTGQVEQVLDTHQPAMLIAWRSRTS